MLKELASYLPLEQIQLLEYVEEVLVNLYEYNGHTVEKDLLITDLLETNQVNLFYTNMIELYKLHTSIILKIIGLGLSSDTLLADKAYILKSLIDINDKEDNLKYIVYNNTEAFDSNIAKLTYILKSLHVLEDPIVLNYIESVSDELIDDIEESLANKEEDDLKDTLKLGLLKTVAKDVLGETEEINETIAKLESFIEKDIKDVVTSNKGLFLNQNDIVLNNIILTLIFTKEGREDSTIAYIKIKDMTNVDELENLDIFIYPIIDKMKQNLIDRGIVEC